jgi:hypothetical protein
MVKHGTNYMINKCHESSGKQNDAGYLHCNSQVLLLCYPTVNAQTGHFNGMNRAIFNEQVRCIP